jgi:hypothetical protein
MKRSRRTRVRLRILKELLYASSVIAAVLVTHLLLKLVVS